MNSHKVVSHDEWIEARKQLLAEEKAFTRQRDALSKKRRDLPWERVEKDYRFESPEGPVSLADLFDGRSQLVVYHFMFAPDWEAGCKSCSFWADNFNGIVVHLNHRDVSLVAISRAPLPKLQAYRRRFEWDFKWVSSAASDFNFDYGVSFKPEEFAAGQVTYNYTVQKPHATDLHGISVFFKDESGAIFHTYSCYARGLDMMNTAYHYLDLVPKGRDEDGRGPAWLRRRDEYDR
jgi:predicted dithiol-disulfide oxidoreductase (DUF899 family)